MGPREEEKYKIERRKQQGERARWKEEEEEEGVVTVGPTTYKK